MAPIPFPAPTTSTRSSLKTFAAYSEFPWAKGLRGGARLFKVVYDNVNARKIEVMLVDARQKNLITGPGGEVLGLVAEQDGKETHVSKPRKA